MWRGGLGAPYLFLALSSAGVSLGFPPAPFRIPLIEPDSRIFRIRLSEKTRALAHGKLTGIHLYELSRRPDLPEECTHSCAFSRFPTRP